MDTIQPTPLTSIRETVTRELTLIFGWIVVVAGVFGVGLLPTIEDFTWTQAGVSGCALLIGVTTLALRHAGHVRIAAGMISWVCLALICAGVTFNGGVWAPAALYTFPLIAFTAATFGPREALVTAALPGFAVIIAYFRNTSGTSLPPLLMHVSITHYCIATILMAVFLWRTSRLLRASIEAASAEAAARSAAVDALRRSDEQLRTLNAELERRVADRTADLQAVNRELEAFSHSVSHDLRAPLRAVNGFAIALQEDHGDQLPADAQRLTGRIIAAASRMGTQIDGLLQLARLGRLPLAPVTSDLSAVANDLLQELRDGEPNRQVEASIAPGIQVYADPVLLRAILQNLLGNAWKFSRQRTPARISLTRTDTARGPAIAITDNGAGFDQSYAERIFAPFQRLHRADEFPGTGLGLAMVANAVRRHGGEIWVDAKVDHGATFYFTLPQPPSA